MTVVYEMFAKMMLVSTDGVPKSFISPN